MSRASSLAAFVREHSEVRRQIHRTLWDRGLRPGDGDYETQAERLGMPEELHLGSIMMLLTVGPTGFPDGIPQGPDGGEPAPKDDAPKKGDTPP